MEQSELEKKRAELLEKPKLKKFYNLAQKNPILLNAFISGVDRAILEHEKHEKKKWCWKKIYIKTNL